MRTFGASGTLTRLTEGDGTHELEFAPDGRHYIDRWSRVDLSPVHELRRTRDGSLVEVLAGTDSFRRQGPRRHHRHLGCHHHPTRFRSGRTLPGGRTHLCRPPRSLRAQEIQPARTREVAELGMVVVQIDGMGTNWRSKAFHDVAWKNLGDSGFPDRIAWIKAAAKDRPWMNIDRVGVYGGSAGGQS